MAGYFVGITILLVLLAGCSIPPRANQGQLREAGVSVERRSPFNASCLYKMPERVYPAPISIAPSVVPTGSRIFLKLGYTVLSPDPRKATPITQVVSVVGPGVNTELVRRRIDSGPGAHISYLRITLPRDGDPGQYTIVSRFITGERETSAKGSFRVYQPRSKHPGDNGSLQARN